MTLKKFDRRRRDVLGAMLGVPLVGCAAEGLEEPVGLDVEALTKQESMDRFYDMGNVVTIRITMPAAKWEELRSAEPLGGQCNWDETRDRFAWYEATSVEVSGTAFPASAQTFSRVGIKKKSFCGSLSTSRPALKLDFGKYLSSNTAPVEALIGTRYLTLNNNKQDESHVRQPLGYLLYKLAGLPYSRCNFVKVYVNGELLGTGMYLNLEPIRERYIEKNFAGNLSGNLYEIEKDDFLESRVSFVDVENLSRFTDRKDLTVATRHVAQNGLAGMAQVFDMPHFLKMMAMEYLLKHWDGYTTNINNTYLYNDVSAVSNPAVGNCKFKLIPWGIDQILRRSQKFKISDEFLLGRLVRNDATRRTQLIDQIRVYRQTVFDRGTQATVLAPFLDQMESILVAAGVPNVSAEIAIVRQQLKLVRSGAYYIAGLPATSEVYVIDDSTGNCLHASDSETIPADVVNPLNWEVYQRAPEDSRSDRWFFTHPGSGFFAGNRLLNVKYSRPLHSSGSVRSSANHLLNYTTTSEDTLGSKVYYQEFIDSNSYETTGHFRLRNERTGLYLKFGTDDLTPDGRPRVYQAPVAEATTLFVY
jgi:hypothetical protein